MTDDSEALAAFRRLLEDTTQPGPDNPVRLTDSLVGPEAGSLLRRCGVPHDFTRALLQRFCACSEAEAGERYAQFAELSIMQIEDGKLSLHERWRQPLWLWWLAPAQRDEFVAINQDLVEWFTVPASLTGEDPAARRRMFHLIGCRQGEGLQLFKELFRIARWRRRFTECSLLLHLVHEYDPVLQPSERTLLTYEEGKLASDLREWERSLPLLRAVADNADAPSRLRIKAQVRVGHALRMTDRASEALALLEDARTRVSGGPDAAGGGWRVLYELGEVYRDLGRIDDASRTLTAALAAANGDNERADVPGILNSLGTVQVKLLETDKAITSYQASLARLKRRGDAVRAAAVLNNLGLAQLERCDWKAAEETLTESLEGKRAAGDFAGQAITLMNMSKAQAAQEHWEDGRLSAEKAAACYEAAGDARGQRQARLAVAKLLRRAGQPAEAAAMLQELIDEAHAAGDISIATNARIEFDRSARKHAIAPWGWLLIAIIGVIAIGILISLLSK
jgi:tetratricopeptide (TPR) repeat protein